MKGLATFVLIGLLLGGLVGFLTRPEAASISMGPINLELRTDRVASSNDPLNRSQLPHIAIFTVIGGLVGAGIGIFSQRRRG